MRSRRHSRGASANPKPGQSGAPDSSAADDAKPPVDSRAYAFAYLIKEPSQVPADFPVEPDFELALFLPKESVPRFEVPRYVPRLALLFPDRLTVYSHPSSGLDKIKLPFTDISYLELERFMADCCLTLFTSQATLALPFHGRDEEHIGDFLLPVQQHLLTISTASLDCNPRAFGPEPGYKFAQIEATLQVNPEKVVTRFYVPPREMKKARLFGQDSSWTFGSEIVVTRNELYVFSDEKDGYRQPYGFRAAWVPLANLVDIDLSAAQQSIAIRLRGDFSLNVPVPVEQLGEAADFVSFIREQIRRFHR